MELLRSLLITLSVCRAASAIQSAQVSSATISTSVLKLLHAFAKVCDVHASDLSR